MRLWVRSLNTIESVFNVLEVIVVTDCNNVGIISSQVERETVLITGGGSGLGRSLVEMFRNAGYNVAFTYRKHRESIDELVESSGGSIFAVQADASDYTQVCDSVKDIVNCFGSINVLINNAASARDASLENSNPDDFDYTVRNVLYPVYYYSKAVLTFMRSTRRGKIINIGSVNGLHGREGSIAYSASKAAIVGLTKTMAKELGKYPINCNVVAPGYIATDGQSKTSELIKKLVLSECYIKRLSEPEAICNMVMFLASHQADNITGQVFQVDCGQYI